METLDSQFADAVRNVSIGTKADRVQAAHNEVRALLHADETLNEWGINSILIGSYGRGTSRFPAKDVDVFLRFENLTVRHDPLKVYDAVEAVLVERYGLKEEGGRVKRQARSLNVDFSDSRLPETEGFSVDAVPAVVWGDHWGIPNKNREMWNTEERRWILTNPVLFAEYTNALAVSADSPTVGGANAYRPVVRLLRQVRHTHLGSSRPGGLAVEVACYHAWNAGRVSGTSYAELVTGTFAAVADEFTTAAEKGLTDPALGTPMNPDLDSWQWSSAADLFSSLALKAREAMAADRCMAAKMWREILGENERGPVLSLPDGCSASGLPLSGFSAVTSTGSDEPRGFA